MINATEATGTTTATAIVPPGESPPECLPEIVAPDPVEDDPAAVPVEVPVAWPCVGDEAVDVMTIVVAPPVPAVWVLTIVVTTGATVVDGSVEVVCCEEVVGCSVELLELEDVADVDVDDVDVADVADVADVVDVGSVVDEVVDVLDDEVSDVVVGEVAAVGVVAATEARVAAGDVAGSATGLAAATTEPAMISFSNWTTLSWNHSLSQIQGGVLILARLAILKVRRQLSYWASAVSVQPQNLTAFCPTHSLCWGLSRSGSQRVWCINPTVMRAKRRKMQRNSFR